MTNHEPYTMPIHPRWQRHALLWAAINRYAEACGGCLEVVPGIDMEARIGAVLQVENAIEELVTAVVEAVADRKEDSR